VGNSRGRFVWYELMTTDMKTAQLFYANVVGWGARDASAPALGYSLFTVADLPVAGLMKMPEDGQKTGAPPHWIGYVGVDDVDSVVDRIKQLGGAVHVPPTDVPGISRFSIVADPQMATLALVKGLNAGQAQSAELGALCRVGWHELLAADWEEAFAFYGELFGWQRAGAHAGVIGTYQQFSADGETLGGMLTKPPAVPFPFWLYYFNVDDVETAAQRVEAGGGQILYGRHIRAAGQAQAQRHRIFYFERIARSLGRAGLPRDLVNENSRLFAIAGRIIAIWQRLPAGAARLSVGSPRSGAAADDKLTDRALHVKLDPGHLRE